jgi:hypothetical protein
MVNSNLFNEQVGLLKTGAIVGYDANRGLLKVQLNNALAIKGKSAPVDVPAPHSLFYNNGLFIGSLPASGTPVVVGQGSGGKYYFVSFLAENLSIVPNLKLGELLVKSTDKAKVTLDTRHDINIGSDYHKIHINASNNLITTNFHNQNYFTQASRKVDGIVKRDLYLNTNYDQDSKLESDLYDNRFTVIGMDPTVTATSLITGASKNPPFVEQREMVYEFQYLSEVNDELFESSLYGNVPSNSKNYNFPNRRKSRADTLSLTLAAPNYLMETVKGTVIDIFGNILDINRVPLPIGQEQTTLRADKSADKTKSYLKIRELERKSLAFHFEINARKDLTGKNGQISLPDINSNENYSRGRSRFFIDIDKEGQFKMNVPASSEKGNIPLLTRYENYSTFGTEDDGNPNKLIYRDDRLDIFPDSFAAPRMYLQGDDPSTESDFRGSIVIKDGDANGSPLDRILKTHIRHGTAYHDILNTCYAHQVSSFLNYQTDSVAGNEEFLTIDISKFDLLQNIVTDTIKISGDDANAGGRSGTFNFDGSVELNIGANTVDRQSLWLDTAGGIVANIGRDLKNMSAAMSLNGDVFVQIGGIGVSGDSRFIKQMNGQIGAIFDLRVFTDGLFTHMVRIDKTGVTIMTPGDMNLHSKGDMRITSGRDMIIEAETLKIQNRAVIKEFGGSI